MINRKRDTARDATLRRSVGHIGIEEYIVNAEFWFTADCMKARTPLVYYLIFITAFCIVTLSASLFEGHC